MGVTSCNSTNFSGLFSVANRQSIFHFGLLNPVFFFAMKVKIAISCSRRWDYLIWWFGTCSMFFPWLVLYLENHPTDRGHGGYNHSYNSPIYRWDIPILNGDLWSLGLWQPVTISGMILQVVIPTDELICLGWLNHQPGLGAPGAPGADAGIQTAVDSIGQHRNMIVG